MTNLIARATIRPVYRDGQPKINDVPFSWDHILIVPENPVKHPRDVQLRHGVDHVEGITTNVATLRRLLNSQGHQEL